LSSATETNGGTTNWSQTNAYDRYGNRQIDYGGGSYNVSFSSTTNRITTSGFSYDSSGNLTNDTIHTYAFDANDKIKSVDSTTAYTYDGGGARVRKLVGENTRFVYGLAGELIAEFDGSSGNLKKECVYGTSGLVATIEPTAANSNGTRYETPDHLGSSRVVTNSSGNVISRHDYTPFGTEIFGGTGGRTTAMGFSIADGLRQSFTSKVRDPETALDFFEARYFASAQGRFTSVDTGNPDLNTPQTLNRFQYCLNNPLRYVDPDGKYNRDVHHDLTLVIALAVGFPESMAESIASADQNTDINPQTQPGPDRHGTGEDRRRKWHFTTEERRQELWSAFEGSGSLDDLGIYMHALQDSYSHEGLSPVNGQVTFDWPWNWSNADDTWRDVSKADRMAENTYNRLDMAADKYFYERHGRLETVPWGVISGIIHDFNTASSEEEKRYVLMVARSRIDNWREERRKARAKANAAAGGSTGTAAKKPKRKIRE